MYQNDIENTLSLLAATIFADKRVYSQEISTFVNGAAKLDIVRKAHPNLSEAKILIWYEANKDRIKGKMMTPYFKDWFYSLLDNLSGVKDKGSLLSVMRDISKSDNDLHVSERALCSLAARYWGVKLSF